MLKKVNIQEIGYNLLTNSDDYITIAAPDNTFKFVNNAYCDLIQMPATELIGKNITDLFTHEQQTAYINAVAGITREKPNTSFTRKTVIAGMEKWVFWKQTGIFDQHGNLIEILSVGRDVSNVVETKNEKEKLVATLTAFKQAIDTNIICTITDAKGVITYANDRFCRISKFTQEELIGKTHNIVNSGYHPKDYFVNIWKTITAGNAWTGELKNKAKDGTYYWVESVIIPIKDKADTINGYLSLRILINEQKKAEEKRSEYLKTMEEMLHTVSHEIRSPIVTCQGLLMLMRDNLLTKEEEDRDVIPHLLASTKELDNYSRKLNQYLENNILSVQQ